MIRAIFIALLVLLATLTGIALWLGVAAHRLLVRLDQVALRAEGIETKANATLINLDKGTAVWAASARGQAQAVEELAVDAHGTLSEVNTAVEGIAGVARHTEVSLDAATSLLGSAERSTDELPAALKNFADVLDSSRSLLLAGSRTNADLQSLLESHAIQRVLDNTAGMTENANGILVDARRVADKETADWLKPRPWWKSPLAKGGQLIDITAAIARHTP